MPEKNSQSNPVIKFIIIYTFLALVLFFLVETIYWLQGWIYIMIMIIFFRLILFF